MNQQTHKKNDPNGRVFAGLIILAVGTIWLLAKIGIPLPAWIYNWELIPITIGLYFGAKNSFRGFGWTIPVLIGFLFLLDDLFPQLNIPNYRAFIWPALVIIIGLAMILNPKRKKMWESHNTTYPIQDDFSSEDTLNITSIFGGVNKNVISKHFKGGEITCIFGGAEINLMQADIQGRVVLETTNVFGGTKIIIPSHWKIQPEITAIIGGVEEKRPQALEIQDPNKILVLKGTCTLGGIEIISY